MRPQFISASILLVTALSSYSVSSYGQASTREAGRLAGTVTDGATAQPIAYASVAVLADDGSPVAGGVCGGDGQFVLPGIPAGTYTLLVRFLGYQDERRLGVVVPAGGTLALGNVPLTAAAQKLNEVVVTAAKRRPTAPFTTPTRIKLRPAAMPWMCSGARRC
jgi:hypothetical protein